LPRVERDIFAIDVDVSSLNVEQQLPDIQLRDMLMAFQDVLKRVDQLSHHQITKEALSVRERMATILEILKGEDSLLFSQLFIRKEGRHGVVVSFLAILELGKEGLIEIIQSEPFTEIRVRTPASPPPKKVTKPRVKPDVVDLTSTVQPESFGYAQENPVEEPAIAPIRLRPFGKLRSRRRQLKSTTLSAPSPVTEQLDINVKTSV